MKKVDRFTDSGELYLKNKIYNPLHNERTKGTVSFVRFFIFIAKGGCVKFDSVIAENKPARLMAIIPADLAAGTYYIEVRTKITSSPKALKNLKTGRFFKVFTCNT